ncbi:MAG: UvrD-helicase domain-containing protein [Rickettsiales bacterium]|nr:UvrD-helicase domain-containing protein [Rickettsiales bacterium]
MSLNTSSKTIALQQIASNPQNSSWVFASAGSGKTKVLINRVLRLLLSGIKPEKILCLTFTKVAATEMQNRINAELANWILLDKKQLSQQLFDLSGKFPQDFELEKARILFGEIIDSESKIRIQTIHAFCQSLLKIFPFEAGIKANFEVLSDLTEKLLLKKAQKEVFKKAKNNSELQILISKINARIHDVTFNELVLELLAKKENFFFLKEKFLGISGIIDEIFKNFSVDKNQSEEEIFLNFLQKIDQQKLDKIISNLEQTDSTKNLEIAHKVKKFLQNPTLKNFIFFQQAFFTEKNEPRKIFGKLAQDAYFNQLISDQRKLIDDFSKQISSYKICDSTALILHFIDHILESYNNLKNQNAFLDYNDLITKTNILLNNPNFANWVKMKIDGLFDHILIDESQDTNHQQWNIIKALSEDFFSGLSAAKNDRTIFIVGDEKQSIYSFQGAQANISQEIFSYFDHKLKSHPKKLQQINLNDSFRSLPAILQAVDQTFIEEKERLAISKTIDFQGHKSIRDGIGRVEIWPEIKLKKIEKNKKTEKDYEWKFNFNAEKKYSAQEFLAENIAIKIKDWVENYRILKSANRPLKYGDFMILLRRRTDGFDKVLSRYFYQYQIPFNALSKIKFSDNLIIQDLLAAANFALAPYDDLNLAALLKSPIFGIDEAELFEICVIKNANEDTIYNALKQLPKFSSSLNFLDQLIKNSQEMNCCEFFYFLLSQENRKKIISRFGVESIEIMDKFCLKVFDFCENFSPNLQKFVEFVDKLNPEISLSSTKNNQVLITTIHSAKGLQAPVVILPDCAFNSNQLRSTKEKISWIDFAQDQYSLPIWNIAVDENNFLKKAQQIKKRQAKDENLRLLYVAMTRAEDELYIGAITANDDDESWYNLIKKALIKNAWRKEFFDEKTKKLPNEKFEINNEIIGIGEEEIFYQKDKNKISEKIKDLNLPEFLNKKTSKDKNIFSQKPNTNQINQGQIRGKIIHKILEIIAKNTKAKKEWLIKLTEKIIAREEFLDEKEKNKIAAEIFDLFNSQQFQNLFHGTIKSEVEIVGNIENQKILRRIDLLIESENEVLIIDYKSDEILPDLVPTQYLAQLKTYEKLIKNIYPDKKISLAILWIKFLKLQRI